MQREIVKHLSRYVGGDGGGSDSDDCFFFFFCFSSVPSAVAVFFILDVCAIYIYPYAVCILNILFLLFSHVLVTARSSTFFVRAYFEFNEPLAPHTFFFRSCDRIFSVFSTSFLFHFIFSFFLLSFPYHTP